MITVDCKSYIDKPITLHKFIYNKKAIETIFFISHNTKLIVIHLLAERTMKKLISTTKEINDLFENKYSEEVINKVKSFYFDEGNLECGKSILEKNCYVSKINLYFFTK